MKTRIQIGAPYAYLRLILVKTSTSYQSVSPAHGLAIQLSNALLVRPHHAFVILGMHLCVTIFVLKEDVETDNNDNL